MGKAGVNEIKDEIAPLIRFKPFGPNNSGATPGTLKSQKRQLQLRDEGGVWRTV
jgi:hypothetical protein